MPRYIDADALIDFLDVGHLRHPSELCFSEVDVANMLLHAPTVDTDNLRPRGRWVDNHIEGSMLSQCSVCFYPCGAYSFNYCPNCGARMKGAEDGTTDNP